MGLAQDDKTWNRVCHQAYPVSSVSIKVSYVMNVLNGEPFLGYQLASIYPYAHEIIITEGAYTRFAHAATPDGHSTDRTLQVIADFPDPQNKITLISHDGFWEDRCEMCNGFMEAVTGEVIWQVDVDEFYFPWVHESVEGLFEADEALDRVSFRVREFFAALDYEVVGGVTASGLGDVRRVHRFQRGDHWESQRPPTLMDAKGELKAIRSEISAGEMFHRGAFIFHPTTLFERQTFDKFEYYRQMWKGVESDQWLYDTWYYFKNPLRLHGSTQYASWIERYYGPYPSALEQMIADIQHHKYPDIGFRDNSDIERYLESPRYREDVKMGETLNNLIMDAGRKQLARLPKHVTFILYNYLRSPLRITYKFCVARMVSFFWRVVTRYLAIAARKVLRQMMSSVAARSDT